MLLITKATTNTIIFTLTEKTTIADAIYLVRWVSDQSGIQTSCILTPEESLFTYRYNQFTLTENDTPDRTEGEVKFLHTGFWTYEIYEQSSSSNLDYTQADNTTPIEVGKALVRVSPTAGVEYDEASVETPVYDG